MKVSEEPHGQRIRQNILKEKRAEYGEEIVPTLSAQFILGQLLPNVLLLF